MGQIHVIDEQPGDLVPKEEQDAIDRLERQVREAQHLAGPIPTTPVFLVEHGVPITHIDPKTGFIVTDSDPGIIGDPTVASQAAIYQAEVEAWNNRFKMFLDDLRKPDE